MAIPDAVPGASISASNWGDLVAEAINPTAWTTLVLSASWTGTLQYRRINDMTWLRGPSLAAGTLATTFATLPVGFRPPATVVLVSACDGTVPRLCGVEVNASGQISIQSYYGGGTVTNVYIGSLGFSIT